MWESAHGKKRLTKEEAANLKRNQKLLQELQLAAMARHAAKLKARESRLQIVPQSKIPVRQEVSNG